MDYRGKVVEISGSGEFSWSEAVDFVLDTTHLGTMTKIRTMDLEEAKLWGMLAEQLPLPIWTEDEVCGHLFLSCVCRAVSNVRMSQGLPLEGISLSRG